LSQVRRVDAGSPDFVTALMDGLREENQMNKYATRVIDISIGRAAARRASNLDQLILTLESQWLCIVEQFYLRMVYWCM
jgi:hypothetical protein